MPLMYFDGPFKFTELKLGKILFSVLKKMICSEIRPIHFTPGNYFPLMEFGFTMTCVQLETLNATKFPKKSGTKYLLLKILGKGTEGKNLDGLFRNRALFVLGSDSIKKFQTTESKMKNTSGSRSGSCPFHHHKIKKKKCGLFRNAPLKRVKRSWR